MQTHDFPPINWARTRHTLLESFWVLAQRFMVVNAISPNEFCYHFERPELKRRRVCGIHVYDRLDFNRLAPLLGHSRESIGMALPMAWEIGIRDSTLAPLKFCEECAELGYHTALFETGWLDVCPIHNRPLRSRCPICRKLLSHVTYRRFGLAPGALACGHTWSGVNIRKAPKLDASSVRRLYDWVRRLKRPGGEETWFGVSLHGESVLRQDDQDFVEFVDCLAAIAGVGADFDHHLVFWLRHFRETQIQTTSSTRLRRDWFTATVERLSRYVAALEQQTWDQQVGSIERAYESLRHLRVIGARRLIDVVRRRICLLPLRGATPVRIRLDDRCIETIAATMVQKHLLSSWNARQQFESSKDFLDFMCRFSGAPLGCFQMRNSTLTGYWIKQIPRPNRLGRA